MISEKINLDVFINNSEVVAMKDLCFELKSLFAEVEEVAFYPKSSEFSNGQVQQEDPGNVFLFFTNAFIFEVVRYSSEKQYTIERLNLKDIKSVINRTSEAEQDLQVSFNSGKMIHLNNKQDANEEWQDEFAQMIKKGKKEVVFSTVTGNQRTAYKAVLCCLEFSLKPKSCPFLLLLAYTDKAPSSIEWNAFLIIFINGSPLFRCS